MDRSAPAKFFKHRPPPLPLKKDIEEELNRQVELGILRPVSKSERAAPVFPVKKSNESVLLCSSYDLTVNAAAFSSHILCLGLRNCLLFWLVVTTSVSLDYVRPTFS